MRRFSLALCMLTSVNSFMYTPVQTPFQRLKSTKSEVLASETVNVPEDPSDDSLVESITENNYDRFFSSLMLTPSGSLKISTEMEELLKTRHEAFVDVPKPFDDEEWTPYCASVLDPEAEKTNYLPGLTKFGLPVPHPRYEPWRYFQLQSLTQADDDIINKFSERLDTSISDDIMNKLKTLLSNYDDFDISGRVVFYNGELVSDLSTIVEGIHVQTQESSEEDDLLIRRLPDGFTDEMAYKECNVHGTPDYIDPEDKFTPYLSKLSGPHHNTGNPRSQFALNNQGGNAAFAALNGAKATSFIKISLAENVCMEKPIQIMNIQGGSGCVHPRSIIKLNEGASCSVLAYNMDLDAGCTSIDNKESKFVNEYTQIFVARGANLKYAHLNNAGNRDGTDLHINTIEGSVAGEGKLEASLLNYGKESFTRTCFSAALLEKAAEVNLTGLNLVEGDKETGQKCVLNTITNIHHVAPETVSNQMQKQMVGQKSTALFKGRIRVEQEAQQTDSSQLCRNIIIDDRGMSRVYAIPSLEIIADDVSCAHGATISDLSEEETFYLRSRGLDKVQARNLLMLSFIRDCTKDADISPYDIQNIKNQLQTMVFTGDREVYREDFQSV